jgi:hypothetical protein
MSAPHSPIARPILFSSSMVRALLAGTKSQTRRAIRMDDDPNNPWRLEPQGFALSRANRIVMGREVVTECIKLRCPYGAVENLLWVRECHSLLESSLTGAAPAVWYWADGNPTEGDYTRPRPSIHMPRYASRLTLRITDVRVEKLQEISLHDAQAEGIDVGPLSSSGAQLAYMELWDSLNGAGSAAANPFVWAISFECIRRNVDDVLRGEAA